MYESFNVKQWIGRVYCAFYGGLFILKMPYQEAAEPLKYAYLVSMEIGDIEYAFLNGHMCLWVQFQISPLPSLHADSQALLKQMTLFGQDHNAIMMKPFDFLLQDLLFNVKSELNCPAEQIVNSFKYIGIQTANKNVATWSHFSLLIIYYLFGHIDHAYIHARACMADVVPISHANSTDLAIKVFYIGLTYVAHARRSRAVWIQSAKKCLYMLKKFSKQAPLNVLGKQYLLEAELASFRRDTTAAFGKFIAAIAVAKEAGFIAETALCNERTAKFLWMNGETARSKSYFSEALSYYKQWGSEPKVQHLTNEINYFFGSSTDSFEDILP
jgi:hypothetical protein